MAWSNVVADGVVTSHAAVLHGLVLLASAAGGDITVYDGTDPNGGRKILTAKGAANVSNPIPFYPPLICERGIYVDVGTSVTEVLIHWDPL